MKFRVERDALADAVTWAARSLSGPPDHAGARRPAADRSSGDALSVSGFDLEASTEVDLEVSGRRRTVRRWCPAGCSPTSPRRCRRTRSTSPSTVSRLTIVVRLGPLHAADDAGRGLPEAAVDADDRRHRRQRRVRHRRGPGRGRRRPRRHPADAHRCPARDRRRAADAGRHRPVPPGGARAGLEPGATRRRAGAGAGPGAHAGRRGQEPGRTATP